MSLKILFLTPWYPDEKTPHHGVFIRDQASAVSEIHKVTVISSKVDYTSFRIFSWKIVKGSFENVTEYRLIMYRSIPFLNQVNYLLVSVWVAWKIGRRLQPDIIHGNIAYPGGIWAYCVSRLLRRPFIVSDHTSRFVDNFRSSFHKVLTLFALKRAHRIIAVSSWAAENIRRAAGIHVDVVPNLIHVQDYAMSHLAPSPVQIGFLGGLSTNRKGLDLLLKAIAGIPKNFVLHIGGEGKRVEEYKVMAIDLGVAEKCKFHGFVEHVPAFMKQLHFFVSSSRTEAFGMVIVEAMASGLPVVATNSGGPADFMDESCGRLVPVEDVDALREGIEWMIDNHTVFDRTLIRKKVEDKYSPTAFTSTIDGFYHKLH